MSVAPTLSAPPEFEKALVKHDWRLRLGWEPKRGMYQILRLRKDFTSHPWNAFDPMTGNRNEAYWHIRDIARSDGSPRSPHMGDYVELRASDTWHYDRPKDFVNDIFSHNKAIERGMAKDRAHIRNETLGDALRKKAKGHITTGFGGASNWG